MPRKPQKGIKKGEKPKDNSKSLFENGGQNGVKSPAMDSKSTSTQSKRKRRSTGGTFETIDASCISKEQFKNYSTDDKLVVLFDMMTCVKSLSDKIQHVEQRVHNIEQSNKIMTDRVKLLEYKSIDHEARARRNNLIFRGIPEVDRASVEDCENTLSSFIEDFLDLDPTRMFVQAVHRIGAPQWRKTRPIIASFIDRKDTELILENAYKLKDTNYGINRDYPMEIVHARSKLWPKYKELKAANKKGTVFIGYPAKLIVNKKVVQDEFPDWHLIMRQQRLPEQVNPTNSTDTQSRPINKTGLENLETENPFDVLAECERSEADSDMSSTNSDKDDSDSETPCDQYSRDMRSLQARITEKSRKESPLNLSTKTNSQSRTGAKTVTNGAATAPASAPVRIDSGASGGPSDKLTHH